MIRYKLYVSTFFKFGINNLHKKEFDSSRYSSKMKLPLLILAALGLATGKSLHTRSLQDDFGDFLALIPTDKIVTIFQDYVENDAQVHDAMIYLMTDDFEKAITTLDHLPEFLNFLSFLEDHGLQAYALFNELLSGLEIPTIAPPTRLRSARRGTGVNGLVNDILAVLPVEQIKALLQQKLDTSSDFKAFYDAVRGTEFQQILATLAAKQEYQDLNQKLLDKGVDVAHIIQLVETFFGLNRASPVARNLEDDLQDFLALIPIEEITHIVFDYLANDAEVQAALAYLQSDDFQTIVVTVDGLPEFRDFLQFLKDKGLDVVAFINQVHTVLGIPTIAPLRALLGISHNAPRRGVGIKGLIDDIIAILPVDQLKALFEEKLQTSPDFKALYDAIRSPEFQSIVEKLNSIPEYQQMLQKLRDQGVDVDYFINLIRSLFGLTF